MLKGLYTAGWGMMGRMKSMDVISNNLANVNTTGFKKDVVVFEGFPDILVGRIEEVQNATHRTRIVGENTLGMEIGEVFTSHVSGSLKRTDRSLDMAIEGEKGAFFTIGILNPEGIIEEYYTRNGSFAVDEEGFLVNLDGHTVLGEEGPIQVIGEDFLVTKEGHVMVEGEEVGRLLIRQFSDTRDLIKYGHQLLRTNPEIEQPQLENFTGSIRQGFLEGSNVNTVKEMVNMIDVLRAYESNQKVIQAVDEILQKAVNEVGTVR
jgi:flagellar basal-body rod protein FlgF